MAVVYLAFDEKHKRQVAIKVLRPDLALGLGSERFSREILIAGRLTHPRIVGLHDSGTAGGCRYFVMPFIDGESLRDRLRREGPLQLDDALRITRQVGEALAFAHESGVVHRDVKPENILLAKGGALVSDFGIAQALEFSGSRQALTETGVIAGTPEYAAPEQSTGSAAVDARADQYCLAIVLYEMLTGRPPFSDPSPQVVFARQQLDPPPPIRSVRPTISEELEATVMRALAKLPVDRYPTVDAFVEALPRHAATPPDPARGYEPGPARPMSLWRELKERRVVQTAIGYLVAAGAVLQIADSTLGPFGREGLQRLVVLATIAGFPLALAGSWLFQISRDGVRRTRPTITPTRMPEDLLRQHAVVIGRARTGFALLVLGSAALAFWILADSEAEEPLASVDNALTLAVLPFSYEDGQPSIREVQRLRDAFFYWDGVRLADAFAIEERFPADSVSSLSQEERSRRVSELGVGRFVMGEVSRLGDSLRVSAGMFDATAGGELIRERTVFLDPEFAGADTVFASLADFLLLGDLVTDGARRGTRSLTARSAFGAAYAAVLDWQLIEATSLLAEAARLDDQYADAQIWLALVRAWDGAPPAEIRLPAAQAVLGRDRLSHPLAAMVDAIAAQARGDLGAACPLWETVVQEAPLHFASWYGLAFCLASDEGVVRDTESPSTWAFRTSYHRSLEAYERAFELLPAILTSFRADAYAPLRTLLMVSGSDRRQGRSADDPSALFHADPAWIADTLALLPHPSRASAGLQFTADPISVVEAVNRLRRRFRDIALSWATNSPEDARALEAVAVSLSLLGDRTALDTLARARGLQPDAEEEIRMVGNEILMGLAFALPGDRGALERVRRLADSVLSLPGDVIRRHPDVGANAAALTGRAHLAATFARRPEAVAELGASRALEDDAQALLVYSAFGGPADSIAAIGQRVSLGIDEGVSPGLRETAVRQWVARPATLSFMTHPIAGLDDLAGEDYLLDLQRAWRGGDTATVRDGLAGVRAIREQLVPWSVTIDAAYPEAWLLVEMGELGAAADWLDPILRSLPQVALESLGSPERLAALIRAAALRGSIAEDLGDRRGAGAWADAVATLWSDADDFLRP